jgi:polyhydroxyalkanoate synthase
MFFLDKKFVSKLQDILINEMLVIPARIRDGSFKLEDMTPGYRFEYLIAPEDLPEVGLTPKEVVWQEGHVKLYHYKAMSKQQAKPPVLMIYALINRPYILDLRPGNSIIEFLVKNGQDVYLIDWGEPLEEDKYLDLDFYIEHYIDSCVDKVRDISGENKINLFGWCIGGSLALIYAALHNEKLNSLATLTTPGKTVKDGMLSVWADQEYFDVDKIINVFGNIPGKFIRYGVIEIYASRELMKNSMYYENINNPQFLYLYMLIEKWMNDNIDFPGKVFKQYIEHVYQKESLFNKNLKIGGKTVDLQNITCPYMNMGAQLDHLVPIDSTQEINKYVGAKENVMEVIPGGHVGLAFEPMSQQLGWTKLLKWFQKHSQEPQKKEKKTGEKKTGEK